MNLMMSAALSDRITTLLAWCADNGIVIDPRLQIRETMDNNGLAVFAVDAIIITGNPESLVQIPKAAVLSVKSFSLAGLIDTDSYGHGAHLSLALALFIEILQGKASRWFGYLQSLPPGIVDTALFWGFDDTTLQTRWNVNDGIRSSTESDEGESLRLRRLSDGEEALMWLRGTEVQKQLRGSEDANTSLLDEIRGYYASTVFPLVSRLKSNFNQTPTLSGFCRAYSLVTSRAFLVDAYHCLAMVPIADAFNHAQENHVQLESDFYVCSMCGSVRECVHDDDESRYLGYLGDSNSASAYVGGSAAAASTITREQEKAAHDVDDCYEMVACAPIVPGSEVYNTYGDELGNAQLLVQYGFLLEGNEHDGITFDLEELDYLVESAEERRRISELWREVDEEWSDEWREQLRRESRLIYSGGHERRGPGRERVRGGVWTTRAFGLNGDGKISEGLWLYCCLYKVDSASRQGNIWEVIKLVRAVVDLQIKLEKEGIMADDDDEFGDGGALLFGIAARRPQQGEGDDDERLSRSSPTTTMAMMMQAVLSLCEAKKGQLGKQGADLSSLGDVADCLPEHMPRTRLAIAHVMSEYSILNACESSWNELARVASCESLLTSDSSTP